MPSKPFDFDDYLTGGDCPYHGPYSDCQCPKCQDNEQQKNDD